MKNKTGLAAPARRSRPGKTTALKFIKGVIESRGIDLDSADAREQIAAGVKDLFALVENAPEKVGVSLDYSSDLLAYARTFRKQGKAAFACIFYAVWIEHTLNRFVEGLARKKGMPFSDTKAMIRDSSYRAKATWLLQLLGSRPLNAAHVKKIERLMEFRNSYVHYKWEMRPMKTSLKEITQLELFLPEFEKTVSYVRRYSSETYDRLTLRRLSRRLSQLRSEKTLRVNERARPNDS